MPYSRFTALKTTLGLRIVEAKRLPPSDSAEFRFELNNRASTKVNACLGPSRRVFYEYRGAEVSGAGSAFTFVDHAGCEREFTIQAGGVISWSETLEMPALSERAVAVEVSIEIVNPRRCDGWGCSALDLKSNQVMIQ